MWIQRAAIGLVAAHGATDVLLPPVHVLSSYALPLLLPTDSSVTCAFWISSVAHLSRDLGALGSLVLHGCVKFIDRYATRKASEWIMLLYMSIIHVPRHYVCMWRRMQKNRVVLTALIASTTAVASALPCECTDICNNTVRRIIIGHVLCNDRAQPVKKKV